MSNSHVIHIRFSSEQLRFMTEAYSRLQLPPAGSVHAMVKTITLHGLNATLEPLWYTRPSSPQSKTDLFNLINMNKKSVIEITAEQLFKPASRDKTFDYVDFTARLETYTHEERSILQPIINLLQAGHTTLEDIQSSSLPNKKLILRFFNKEETLIE